MFAGTESNKERTKLYIPDPTWQPKITEDELVNRMEIFQYEIRCLFAYAKRNNTNLLPMQEAAMTWINKQIND